MKHTTRSLSAFTFIAAGLLALTPACAQQVKTAKGKTQNFLFLSDVHLNTASDSTAYGGDTGMDLWNAFVGKVDNLLASPAAPAFIVYTGDLPAHYSCSESCYLPPAERTQHNNNLTAILAGLHKIAEKHRRPIFYLPGNNDALAGYYYSFADETQATPLSLVPQTGNFFPLVNAKKKTPPCMVSDPHPTMGYYSAYPVQGLRLIALNTIIYNAYFTTVDGTTQQNDGNTQMTWLAAQLADAAAKKEKVYLAMHVPPGLDAYSGKNMWVTLPGNINWLNSFLALTTRYKNAIAGILYGHTHMDEVRRLYDTTGTQITEVAISCPGVTPQHYNNPGFKMVQYDAGTKELTDFTTYYTKPTATTWGDSTYTFSKSYSIPPGNTIFNYLSAMPLSNVSHGMSNTFTVKNGAPGYNITTGIEVKPE